MPVAVPRYRLMPLVGLWRSYFNPIFFGLEHIPRRGPVLLVGNHSLMGVWEPPLIWQELRQRLGLDVRTLGDHFHEYLPGWRDLLHEMGVVDGTRENCARLMEEGACIMVYPGGAREVAKRTGEEYQLIWQQRLGFVRMAVRHGCPVVPFASVGPEDCYRIVADSQAILSSPFGKLIRGLGIREDLVMPLVRGVGPSLLPRPERFYFRFGTPIDPLETVRDEAEEASLLSLRAQVRRAIEAHIADLKEYRREDPGRYSAGRWGAPRRRNGEAG